MVIDYAKIINKEKDIQQDYKIYIIPKKKEGNNPFSGTSFSCPAHEKKNKSDSINTNKQARNNKKRRKVRSSFLAIFKKRDERYFIKGINNLILNNYQKAIEYFRRAYDKRPENVDNSFMLAILAEKAEEKIAVANSVIEYSNKLGKLFNKYHIRFLMEYTITKDIKLLVANDYLGIHFLISEILFKADKINEAIKLLENSTIYEELEITILLAMLYLESNRYEDCIRVLEGMEGENIIGTLALLLKGQALRNQNLNLAAIHSFRRARRRNKDRPISLIIESRYQLGLTMEKEGKNNLARKEYEKILAINYDYADVRDRIENL